MNKQQIINMLMFKSQKAMDSGPKDRGKIYSIDNGYALKCTKSPLNQNLLIII